MIIFVLIFICLYGGINFYAFSRVKKVLHLSVKAKIIIKILLVLMVLAPVIIRLAESHHLETLARSIAYIGYLWMAFVFLFFFLDLALNVSRNICKFFFKRARSIAIRNIVFGLSVFLSVVFVIYGFYDAQIIRVKRIEIQTDKLLLNNGKIRIVQISDVHIGLIIRDDRLQKIIDCVKEADPDILVSTGDLVDGELNNVMPQSRLFADIKPKYGKYAVTGNHEYYAGIGNSLEFTKNAGFEILRDEVRQIAGIAIAGIDDVTGRKMGIIKDHLPSVNLLHLTQSNKFILLLKHQPIVNDNENFNLQLSGHTHGGQLFPFMLITRLFFSKNYGYYNLGEYKSLYVTRGAGTWGPPVRILAPPEITIIDLIGKKID
ncbi:MAG: hypothetical protein APR62_07825 [Smithella sp. SDB]|nr:MAG: hypothetical protein APR62_07825 [Smithella sp. SDB]